MKILIAYDGSSCADSALEDLRRAGLPRQSEAIVLSVAKLWSPALESAAAGEEQISRNSRQLGDLAQSNQDLLGNLSLPTKLSNDFNNRTTPFRSATAWRCYAKQAGSL